MIKELKESTQALQSDSDAASRSATLASSGVGIATPAAAPVDLLSSVAPMESDASVILLDKSDAKPQLTDVRSAPSLLSV
jgi:hypothetical protein